MIISEHYYTVDQHRNNSTLIHVTTSDGDQQNWMTEIVTERENGEKYIREVAAEDVKDDWLHKLGYLIAAYTGQYLKDCQLTLSIID
jgi:hypothetical protein